ncbi:chemokine-like factor [Lissotriton helveticus]
MKTNLDFFKKPRGILKIIRCILILIALILFILGVEDAMFLVVTGIEVAVVILFILLYLLMLDKKITFFKWPRVDFFNCIVSGVFVCIVCCIAIHDMFNDLMLTSGVLGLIESVLTGVEAVFLYKEGCLKK